MGAILQYFVLFFLFLMLQPFIFGIQTFTNIDVYCSVIWGVYYLAFFGGVTYIERKKNVEIAFANAKINKSN